MKKNYHSQINSDFGIISLSWGMDKEGGWKIININLSSRYLLPSEPVPRNSTIINLEGKIKGLLEGRNEAFPVNYLDLSPLKPWHRQVLLLCSEIPRGFVRSYRSLADTLGMKGARAIGWAMSHNPFPLVIPCHRVVKADGSIGGYGGGIEWKKKLLIREGVLFSGKGTVDQSCFISP